MILLRAKEYIMWFLVNFFICLIPCLIMIAMNRLSEEVFSSFLSYNYTLLISSLYLIFTLSETNKNEGSFPTLLFWITIAWLLLIFSTFIIYPDIPNKIVSKWFSDNYLLSISIILIFVTFTISFFLNFRSMEKNVKDKKAQKDFQKAKKTEKKVSEMHDQI